MTYNLNHELLDKLEAVMRPGAVNLGSVSGRSISDRTSCGSVHCMFGWQRYIEGETDSYKMWSDYANRKWQAVNRLLGSSFSSLSAAPLYAVGHHDEYPAHEEALARLAVIREIPTLVEDADAFHSAVLAHLKAGV